MGTKHTGRNCNNRDRERYSVQPDRERECALLVAQSVVVKKICDCLFAVLPSSKHAASFSRATPDYR
jgi:hypothetical protein